MGIETSVVVEFGDGVDTSDYIFDIATDDESNDDKTSFVLGDAVVFRVNHSNNVQIIRVIATDGSVRETAARVPREQTDEFLFANDNVNEPSVQRLSIVPTSSTIEYMGRQGILTRRIPLSNIVEYVGDVTRVPFRAKIKSRFDCRLFTLQSPRLQDLNTTLEEDESYTIDVVFYIRVNE